MSKSRSWCFTLNNYTDADVSAFQSLECEYIIFGKEVGESGTPHLQGYIYFSNARSFASVKKIHSGMHLEVAKGNTKQNVDYCSKDGDVHEHGTRPTQGKRSVHSEVLQMVSSGKSMRDIVEVEGANYQTLKSAELLFRYKEKKRDWCPKVIWIYGVPRVGKTRYIYDNFDSESIFVQNAKSLKFWMGYDAHPNVLIDEVDSATSYPDLKALTDRYPYSVESKGGSRQFLATTIVITSLNSPMEVFQNYPYNGAEMLGRIDVVLNCVSGPTYVDVGHQKSDYCNMQSP